MKILIVGQNFQMGGIQRALINLLDIICSDINNEVDLFVFGNGPLLNEVPQNVRVISGKPSLRLVSTPFSIVKDNSKTIELLLRIILMFKVRLIGSKKFYESLFLNENKLNEYDIAISYFNDVPYSYFGQGTNQYVDEFVSAKEKIAWIHNDPLVGNFDKINCRKIYKNFNHIACVSYACSNKFKKFLPEYAEKVITSYNFFPINKIRTMSDEKSDFLFHEDIIYLITVARIDNHQKRLNIIPEIVIKLVNSNITNFRWIVVGDGPDLASLIKRVCELGIEKYLDFIGNKLNPYPYIKAASLFVLVSKYEGYPMVIGESLILGTPVLTTNFAAASEQILNNKNGIIVDMDENSVFQKISELLQNTKKIQSMRDYIVKNPYTNKIAVEQLRNILEVGD